MPRNPNGFVWTRIPANRRAKRGYKVEYFHGRTFTFDYFAWSHYDVACDYLQRSGLALNDVGEVLVNFSEDELRDLLTHKAGDAACACVACDRQRMEEGR